MGIIKLGLVSLLVFILLITGISLFFPSHIRISKAIDIRNTKDSVLIEIGRASHWKNWFPGADSLAPYVVHADTTGLLINEKQALLVTEVTDNSVLAAFTGPGAKRGTSGWNILADPAGNFVTVQWYMDFRLRWYPWEKFSSMLLEKRYGPLMEKGLDQLKRYMEKGEGSR